MWLNADQEFTIPNDIAFIDVYLDATAVQKRFPPGSKAIACDSRELGAPEPATGPGYMGVTSAAYLIATEGGMHNFFLRDTDEWAHAYKALLSHVAQGTVETIGRPAGKPFHEKLDGKLFSSVFIRFYLDDPATIKSGSEPVLDCSYPKSATDQTLPYYAAGSRSAGDSLLVNGKVEFSNLEVLKSDIADAFPFVEARKRMISKRRAASKSSTSLSDNKSTPRPAPIPKAQYDRLYCEWIEANRLSGTTRSFKHDTDHFAKFGIISRTNLRKLRNKHAPPEWKHPGPKRANPAKIIRAARMHK
jgi:hypothetical protein